MHVVRSLVSGPWRSVDRLDGMGQKIGEKVLVRALEHGRWSIDNRAVDVEPGLCVSFLDDVDAGFFLNTRRADYVVAEPDSLICFESESDAQFFISRGLGELLSQREVNEIVERMKLEGAQENHDDGEQGGDDDDGAVETGGDSDDRPARREPPASSKPKGARSKGRR